MRAEVATEVVVWELARADKAVEKVVATRAKQWAAARSNPTTLAARGVRLA